MWNHIVVSESKYNFKGWMAHLKCLTEKKPHIYIRSDLYAF